MQSIADVPTVEQAASPAVPAGYLIKPRGDQWAAYRKLNDFMEARGTRILLGNAPTAEAAAGLCLADSVPADAEPVGPTADDEAANALRNTTWDASAAAPGEPRLPMAEAVAAEAAYYRSRRTALGELIAETLDALVGGIRATGATNPDDYRGRIAAMDEWAAAEEWERAETQGFDRGARWAESGTL